MAGLTRGLTGWEYSRVICSGQVRRVIALLLVMMAVSVAPTATAAPPSGGKVARTVRVLMHRYPLRSVLYGVWINRRRLVIGALGESQPGAMVR